MAGLNHIDPELLQTFIAEADELIDALDQHLVALECSPQDTELRNAAFRAVHTIKGSGGFLGLSPLTDVAHAAEDALNTLRQDTAKPSRQTMDLLLRTADVLRRQVDQLRDGRMPDAGDAELQAALRRVGADEQANESTPTSSANDAPGEALEMSQDKLDLLEFMVDDLARSLEEAVDLMRQLAEAAGEARHTPSVRLRELAEELHRAAEFFRIETLAAEVAAVGRYAERADGIEADTHAQAHPRAEALLTILQHRAEALREQRLATYPTQTLIERLDAALQRTLPDEAKLPDAAAIEQVFAADGLDAMCGADSSTSLQPTDVPAANSAEQDTARRTTGGEQTIRVDVDRLESLLNLVGELVLQKNRAVAMHRDLSDAGIGHELSEQYEQLTSDLDRITDELQFGVMKARLQPLSKLFARYPRLVRDLERATDKQIKLTLEGGETEVDRTVLERIGDPLVHILRNCASHGIETPDQRRDAGKDVTGQIRLVARHEGSHVLIEVSDDGRGIDPDAIGDAAVARRLTTPDELASMTERQKLQLIFAAGFSTAEQVSDVAGRGVGMDVVRSNIAELNGMIDIESRKGEGTTLYLRLPLTLAIMPAMIVQVATEQLAVPLANTHEIVRLDDSTTKTVNGQPTLHWRGDVIPLVDLGTLFQLSGDDPAARRFALVVALGEQRVALAIDRPRGQQEVVIKPLDRQTGRCPAIGSATVREDGGVSLIVDVAGLFEMLRRPQAQAA